MTEQKRKSPGGRGVPATPKLTCVSCENTKVLPRKLGPNATWRCRPCKTTLDTLYDVLAQIQDLDTSLTRILDRAEDRQPHLNVNQIVLLNLRAKLRQTQELLEP